MKTLCIICELWLVEPLLEGGKVTYFCLRCAYYPPEKMSLRSNNVANQNSDLRTTEAIGRMEMQPVRPLFYVYSSSPDSDPLDYGTAFYSRVFISDSDIQDFKWDTELSSWVPSEYLGRLLSRGEPTLDQIDESQLPEWIHWPIWK